MDEAPQVTPEMLAAGAEVLYRWFHEVLPYESSLGRLAANEVWTAMQAQASGPPRRVQLVGAHEKLLPA